MTEIVTVYVHHLMRKQATVAGQVRPHETRPAVPIPTESYPSFDHFCAEREPGISIAKYTDRLVTYMHCSSEVFIFALAYLRRLLYAGFPIHARSIHRLLLTAIVVAAKMRDDHYYTMGFYAQVGGVSTKDLNTMELRFLLDLIQFRAEVLVDEYQAVMHSVAAAVQAAQPQLTPSESGTNHCNGSSTSSHSTSLVDKRSSRRQSNGSIPPEWAVECDVFW